MLNTTFIEFHKLPTGLKQAVTSPTAMAELDRLETKYHVPLADLVVKLMIRDLPLGKLTAYLTEREKLPEPRARQLSEELRGTVLRPVLSYLETPVSAQQPARSAPPRVTAPVVASVGTAPQPSVVAPPLPTRPMAQRQPPVPPPAVRPTAPPRPPQRPSALIAEQQSGRTRAAYFLYAEDEEDIAKHRDRLARVGGPSPTARVQAAVEEMVRSLGLENPDRVLSHRIRMALLSRLRDVRTSDELREFLLRSPKLGGMGYDEAATERVVLAADIEAGKLHDRDVAGHLAEIPPPAPPILGGEGPPALEVTTTKPPAAVLSPQPPHQVQPPPPVPKPQPPRPKPQEPPAPPVAASPPPLRRPVEAMAPGRPVVQDIRRPARPVGPIEELGSITPDDFRGLGRNLTEAVEKILEKIQLLAEDTYEKRSLGIKAWRRSPIHKLYLTMGQESMTGAMTIEEIIAARRRRNEPYLTVNEFAAIADLNHQLTP